MDELVFIQLTIRTREDVYNRIYDELYDTVGGDWGQLLQITDEELLEIMEGGGMARIKLQRLQAQIEAIRERFGVVSLDRLHEWPTEEAEEFLVSLPGVGPKAARCVLLYPLERNVFPVDSHCRRILRRLGVLPAEVRRKAAHNFLQDLLPSEIRHSLHVNLVHHGRSVCLPGTPACDRCCLNDLCPVGQQRLKSN